jgi:hypothetical protein
MADNINVDPGTGVGAVPVATDDVGGVQYQIIKIVTGGDGVATPLSNAAPLPISDAGGTVTVDGTVTVGSLPVQFGAGASTSTTQRVTIDSGQVGSLVAGSVPCVSGGYEYETVAVSQTDQILGATGAVGDYLECLLCVVATAATSQVQIKDGNGSAITVLPNAVGAGVGTYPIPIGLTCINATTPGWKITTAAGVTVLACGNFT